MFIVVANEPETQVTVIRTISNGLASSHTAILSVDGRVVKQNVLIHRKCPSDKSEWEQVNHPGVTPFLKVPNPEVIEVLSMSAAECISSVIDDAGIWNQPIGKSSDNLLSDTIAIVDVDRTVFTQDINEVDEFVPVWATSYVRDYYNSPFTDLELQLANTLLHVTVALEEVFCSRRSSVCEPKIQVDPVAEVQAPMLDTDKKDPPVNPGVVNGHKPVDNLFGIIGDGGHVEDTHIDKSYSQVSASQDSDDHEDLTEQYAVTVSYPTYRGMNLPDLD